MLYFYHCVFKHSRISQRSADQTTGDVHQLSDLADVGEDRSTMVAAAVPCLQDSDENQATGDVHQLSDVADAGKIV